MQVVYGCAIILIWTIVSSAQGATIKTATQIQSRPKNNQAVAIETAPVLLPSQRSKRQELADVATAFVGLRVRREARSEDYEQIKEVARRVRGRSARPQRSLNVAAPYYYDVSPHYGPALVDNLYYAPVLREHKQTEHHHHHHHHKVIVVVPQTPTTTTPAPPQLLTEAQETFSVINQNLRLARNLREEYVREFNDTVLAGSGGNIDPARVQAVNGLIVVRENRIICNDVCGSSQGEGVSYGTLGICTPRFCQCDYNLGRNTRIDCQADMVFDPISLSCKSPFKVALCNDEKPEEPKQTNVNQQVLFVPKYILTQPFITSVAPLSIPLVSKPYFFVNSLGNTGVQNFASPSPVAYSAAQPLSLPTATPTPSPFNTFSFTVSPMTDFTVNETQGKDQVSPESHPSSALSTTAAPISQYSRTDSSTSAVSSQSALSQQHQNSLLGPYELNLLNQLLSHRILPFDQHSNQQGLSVSQLNLQQNPALPQFAHSTEHSTSGSTSNVDKQRACGSVQTINCLDFIETVRSLERDYIDFTKSIGPTGSVGQSFSI